MYLRHAGARATAVLAGLLALRLASPLPAAGQAAPTSTGTPPPTMVPVPGGGSSPSPFPSVLHTPEPSTEAPTIRASSAILADLDTGQVLFSQGARSRRPIASLTKIMTALLVIERTSPSELVTVSADAADPNPTPGVSNLGLEPGERIRVGDLLYALLLQSANDAAVALAEHVSGSVQAFVEAMNAEARSIGANDTRFASPSGLDDDGYSTAADIVTITRVAYSEPLFAKIVSARFHEVPPAEPGGDPRMIQNRNVLLWLYPGAIGGKTGFTSAAGYCLMGTAERDGRRLVTVILDNPGEPFSGAAALLDFGFDGFERRTLVGEGESLGTVAIQSRRVGVSAGGSIDALVPVAADILRRIQLRPGSTFPPATGERVGLVTVTADGLRLGRVPLVVSEVPPPRAPDPGSWWSRSSGAAIRAVSSLLHAFFG